MTNKTSQNGKASTQKALFSRTTTISIHIEAKRSIVWAILTNVDDFPRWNSTIVAMSGNIEQGKKIQLKSILDEKREFNLTVEALKAEEKMVWADGQAPFFRAVRTYSLSEGNDGGCDFTMTERFGGIMAPIVLRFIPDLDASFEQFSTDLKTEAEAIQKANAAHSSLEE